MPGESAAGDCALFPGQCQVRSIHRVDADFIRDARWRLTIVRKLSLRSRRRSLSTMPPASGSSATVSTAGSLARPVSDSVLVKTESLRKEFPVGGNNLFARQKLTVK